MSEFDTIFYRDAYCREFDSVVKTCTPFKKKYAVELEDTAFYPEGGGQPGDTGTLNDQKVEDTRKSDGRIIHIVSDPITEGTPVHGVIDWERRFDHMVMHTGEHMVSGLIHQTFGYDNVGFHMGEDAVTIDFNGSMDWDACMRVEAKANELVRRNLPVSAEIPDEKELARMDYRSKKELHGEVRIVTVPEADVCACCGTHLKSTGEIGYVKLISLANHRDGVRIEMLAGKRAEEFMRKVMDQNLRISHLLSARVLETSDAVERLLNGYQNAKRSLRIAAEESMKEKIASLVPGERYYIAFAPNADHEMLRYFANAILQKTGAESAAAFSEEDGECRYVIVSETVDLRKEIRGLNQELNGRGGGSPQLVQGVFRADSDTVYETVNALFQDPEK